MDHVLDRQVAGPVPGVSVAVIGDGGVVETACAGLAAIAERRAATPETIYLWFSMTKIVTATAVMRLVERAALRLDDPVREHLPWFPEPRPGRPAVRVRHLLSHSAGLANPIPVRWVHRADQPGRDPDRLAREQLAKHRRLRAPAGERAAYSNLGYIVLGELIATASGRGFEEFVREEILAPLEMRSTGFGYDELPGNEVATGYQLRRSAMTPLFRLLLPPGIVGPREGRFVSFRRFLVDGPAYGGLVGSVADAARFAAMHINGGELDGVRVLSAPSVRAMQTVQARGRGLDVGYGWFRRGADRERAEFWEHLGGGGGFWNMIRVYPECGVGVVCMGNATRYDHDAIAAAALARVRGGGP